LNEGEVDEKNCAMGNYIENNLGEWIHAMCDGIALAICQKKQIVSLGVSEKVILHLESKIKQGQMEINKLIPIGFIYAELPLQSEPSVLWPTMKWTEVTKIYAGYFFRAEGPSTAMLGT